jgi:hypothetical protein
VVLGANTPIRFERRTCSEHIPRASLALETALDREPHPRTMPDVNFQRELRLSCLISPSEQRECERTISISLETSAPEDRSDLVEGAVDGTRVVVSWGGEGLGRLVGEV